MKEMIKREEVLDIVSIDNIKTLAQADEILEACNASDGDVLETYVQNAITRGAVYHKLTEVEKPNGNGEYYTQIEMGVIYNCSTGTVNNYISIYNNGDIVLRKLLGNIQHAEFNLKPTLRSLLDTIKKDPDNVTKMVEYRINSRGIVNQDTVNTITNYMNEASEDIRYLFSTQRSVALGRLASAIEEKDKDKIIHIIKLNGSSEKNADIEMTRRECADALKSLGQENTELLSENDMLKRRNKFLVESYKLNDIHRLINRALTHASKLRRYKPEMQEAMDILGVDATVDILKLKTAYKNKVSIHHSDITGDDETFRKIIEANKLVKSFIEGL